MTSSLIVSSLKIPLVDFTIVELRPGTSLWQATSKGVCNALEEFGFFAVKYGKTTPELDNAIFSAIEDLFDLPMEVKTKNVYDKPFHGHVAHPLMPLHESMGIDNATARAEVEKFTNIMWPNGNDSFCEIVHSYAKVMEELDRTVMRMIFEGFGIEENYNSHMELTSYTMKFNKNLPPPETETETAHFGHTDKNFITILHHTYVNGLEVQKKNGEWVTFDIEPSSSFFIVLAGDVCMAWSNDRIHAPEHRVTMARKEPRYTIGLFSFTTKTIEVPEELVDEEHPIKYKPLNNMGFLHFCNTGGGLKYPVPIKAYSGL